MGTFIFLCVAAAIGWFVFQGYLSGAKSEEARSQLGEELRRLEHQGEFSTVNAPLPLNDGEFAVLCESASTYEMRRQSGTKAIGTRVKVGGLPIFLGQSSTKGSNAWELQGSGTVVLTNKRLVYIGSGSTFSASYKEILQLEAATDGVLVHTTRRQKPIMLTCNRPMLLSAYFQITKQHKMETPKLPQGTKISISNSST